MSIRHHHEIRTLSSTIPAPPNHSILGLILVLSLLFSIDCRRSSTGGPVPSLEFASATGESGSILPAVDLRLNEAIRIEFNLDLAPASVTPETVVVAVKDSDPPILAVGEFQVEQDVLTFVPRPPTRSDLSDSGLLPGTSYEVRLIGNPEGEPSLRAVAGTHLEESIVLEFLTTDREPFYLEEQSGRPQVLGFALDLDGDGTLLADGDLSTREPEEFPATNSDPIPVDVPLGLARAPIALAILFDEPLDPTTVLIPVDRQNDGSPDPITLLDVETGARIPHRLSLRADFLRDEARYQMSALILPETTLPAGTRLEVHLTSQIQDLLGEPLTPSNPALAFQTRTGPGSFQDLLTENFENRRRTDQSATTAAWNQTDPGALAPTDGLGGSGELGELRIPAGTRRTLNTSGRGRLEYSSIHVEAGATLVLRGTHPAEILARGDIRIEGEIQADGQSGDSGSRRGGMSSTPGGQGGPGGGQGGSANSPAGVPIGTENCQFGESGGSPSLFGGGEGGKIGTVFAGGGAGGGYAEAGGSALGANNARGGLEYGDRLVTELLGGSGGGAGGDGSPGSSGTAAEENTGGAGGGGGGALLLSSSGTLTLAATARISANGGDGGLGGLFAGQTPGGGGGGGGSGGAIKLRATQIDLPDVSGARIFAFGGNPGIAGGRGSRQGAEGADGRIRLEAMDRNQNGRLDEDELQFQPSIVRVSPSPSVGIVEPIPLRRSTARSTFFDTGNRTPRYRFDASDPITGLVRDDPSVEDITLRNGIPSGTSIQAFFQGAHEDPMNPGEPDLDSVTELTRRIEALNGFRFIRFQLEFTVAPDLTSSPRPIVEQIRIPFEFEI